MESATIRSQLMVLFDNLKSIQPNERDNLITFIKKNLSQLQENNEKNDVYQSSNISSNSYPCFCSENVDNTTTVITTTATTTNVSLTSSSSAYANVKSSELYDLTNINVNSLQLSFEATPESVATFIDEVNDFSALTIQHNTTGLTGHNCSEAIYVNECLSMATNAPTLNYSNLNSESNFHETLQEQNPIPLDSNVTDNNHTSNSIINYEGSNYETYLNCPLCRVTFENWPNLECHLYNDHVTNNVEPVCWRCQGIFKNHAVLLAHECFDWGRLYLPCTVYMNKSLKSFHKFSKIDLEKKQFPMDGVFLSRRCGLCYKSNVMFTSYDAFEKHKSSSHSTTGRDGGYGPPTSCTETSTHTPSSLLTSTRKKKQSLKCNSPSDEHPSSDVAVRSVVRNLTEHFYALNYHQEGRKRRERERRVVFDNNHNSTKFIKGSLATDLSTEDSISHTKTMSVITTTEDNPITSTTTTTTTTNATAVDVIISTITNTKDVGEKETTLTLLDISNGNNDNNNNSDSEQNRKSPNNCSPSTFLTSLLVAQRVKHNLTLKNKRARQLKAVAFECDSAEKRVTDEVDEHLSTTTALSCDVPPSPSIGSHISEGEIQFFHNRRSSWLHRHKNTRRLKLQLKRKTTINGRQKISVSTSFTNNAIKIRRFICNHCSAVFRLSSRLRAHYLFQHGHIPECLGGLSPRPNEILFNKQRNISRSRSSSSSNNNDDSNSRINHISDCATSQKSSLHNSENMSSSLKITNTTTTTTTTTTPMSVTSTFVLSSIPNESSSLPPPGLITRLRKRKAVSDNNNNTTMDTSIQSANQLTQNARRIKKQTNDTLNNNHHNNENEVTGLLYEHSQTNEIDEQLISKSNLLYKQHYCNECNCTFKSAYNLKRHQKIVHLHQYRYFCGYCEFRTGERLAYEEHLARHFCVKQFVCEICNARFTIKHELDDHRAFKHSNERNFACTECDQRFKTAGTLWRHKKTHEKRVYHLCPICSTSFTRLSNLNRHLLRTHKQQNHHQSINNHNELLMMDSNKKLSTSQRSSSLNNKQKRTKSRQPCSKVLSNINNHETSHLNQNHISSCQQTVEQVIPVKIITPHLPGSDLSSNHQTLMNIIPDQDSRSSKIISISDNIDKSILINPTISTSCSDTSSSSSLPSTIPKILPTQDHVIVTTECSIIPTNASGYQAVNLDSSSTVFMLNFSDLDANSHAFFEPTDVLSDSHDNLQHKMMIAVRDPVYEQATAFPTSLVVSSSLSSSSNGTLTSSTLSSSPKVSGTTITLQSNLLLPIQLTTNSFSAITTSSLSHNNSVNCDVITNNSDTNSWSTMISRQLEPSLCYLITATETIENGVLCSHGNDTTNTVAITTTTSTTTTNNNNDDNNNNSNPTQISGNLSHDPDVTDLNVDHNDDVVSGVNIIEDTPHSISSVDILNSLQTDMVDNMMNGTVLKIGSQSPQLSLASGNCIFYDTHCSSTLTTTHSSVSVPASSSLSSSSCPNSSSSSFTPINQSTSIWRPVDCETSMLNKQENRPFQAGIASHSSTINTANNIHNNNHTNNHNATSAPFTGDDGDAYPVEYYDQRYHQIQHVFPLMSKTHDSYIYDGGNHGDDDDVDDDDGEDAEEEDNDYTGLVDNHVSTNNLTISNNNKSHQITTDLLDTSVMLSWNPTNDNNNNHSTEFLDYPHYSPKFPSPDPNNLSPSSIHLDRQQHQQPFELLNFPQSRHDQIISNPVTSLTGVLSPRSLLSPSSSISTSTPSSSSSLLYENNFNDCANFLGQFYHHNTSISNINLSYKNSYNTLSNTPNVMHNIENTCYPSVQLNDHDEIPDVTDQCSNFSVGYLIGHSTMPPSSSSSIGSSSSRCLLLQTGEKTKIISSTCQSSTDTSNLITGNINYLNSPQSSFTLSDHHNLTQQQSQQQQQHQHELTSISQLNFSKDPVDYEFVI
ncbi:unnamed protein product [Schistosoma bovis]|nr:unnamed protein product [Schistosoma bovis]